MTGRFHRSITMLIVAAVLVAGLSALSNGAQAARPEPSYSLTCTWNGNYVATLSWTHVKISRVFFTFYTGDSFLADQWGSSTLGKRPRGSDSVTQWGSPTSVIAKVVYPGTDQPAEPPVATANCTS